MFLGAYGLARFLVEFVRQPDAHIGLFGGIFSIGQLLSLPMIIVGFICYAKVGVKVTTMANHRIKDTALFDKIVATISKNGPLSLATFINSCPRRS